MAESMQMTMENIDEHVASMTVAEFKAFRKAVAVLMRTGITRGYAVSLLITGRKERW